MTRCRNVGVSVLALVFAAVAAQTSGASTTKQAVLKQAVKDEVAVYNGFKDFSIAAAKLSASATLAQHQAVVALLGSALKDFQGELRTQQWPPSARRALRQVDAASTPFVAEMALVGQQSSAQSESQWSSKVTADQRAWLAALDVANRDLGLPPFTANGSAVDSCQADGATVATASAAFRAVTHGLKPSASLLTGKDHGGPFLQSWPLSAHYSYSLNSSGTLMIAVPPSVRPVTYVGPTSCADAGV